ncbi:MAG: peptidase U32 family protein, partial [Porphyromonadaceae bacterium]|nr:peptidase U32 family protein [Porphyromonadaceae bacterium]
MKELELLSPAKDLQTAIAAIDHGADAIYIGAPVFSARASGGVSIEDIRKVCEYAHLFKAKVFVALNTILYESELKEVEQIITKLDKAGIDALIIQDKAITELDIPNIPLHASTQCDNRTISQIKQLKEEGFERVVVARELNIEEIQEIAKEGMEIEAFVHGALCVSISGLCYVSQYLTRRSANRGTCAQICRLPFDLTDADGNIIVKDRHLLSLKDMNRSEYLSEMAKAGVTSFKIEGRLKSIPYVKNVTAAYSINLNNFIKLNPNQYKRASVGEIEYSFSPDLT